ncbi:MAG TPA: hypothetical protein V6C97_14650 [Oculatellaceae cyanobacterium]
MNKMKVRHKRGRHGVSMIEAIVCLCVIVPLILFGVDVATVTCMAQVNEELSEQLARLCSTVQTQANAQKACQDVLNQYQKPANVSEVDLASVLFDQGLQQVTVSTVMNVNLPVPFLGQSSYRCTAKAMQPVISSPAAQ